MNNNKNLEDYYLENKIPYYICTNPNMYKYISKKDINYNNQLYTPLGVNRELVEHRIEHKLNLKGLPKKI
jgi:hypothetical protein